MGIITLILCEVQFFKRRCNVCDAFKCVSVISYDDDHINWQTFSTLWCFLFAEFTSMEKFIHQSSVWPCTLPHNKHCCRFRQTHFTSAPPGPVWHQRSHAPPLSPTPRSRSTVPSLRPPGFMSVVLLSHMSVRLPGICRWTYRLLRQTERGEPWK